MKPEKGHDDLTDYKRTGLSRVILLLLCALLATLVLRGDRVERFLHSAQARGRERIVRECAYVVGCRCSIPVEIGE